MYFPDERRSRSGGVWTWLLRIITAVLIIAICWELFTVVRTVLGSINSALSNLFNFFGVTTNAQAQQGWVNDQQLGGNWIPSPSQLQQQVQLNPSDPHDNANPDDVYHRLKNLVFAAQSFWGGCDTGKWVQVVETCGNKTDWLNFCTLWQLDMGTPLLYWARSGWLGGLVSRMSVDQLAVVDNAINQLPAQGAK